MATPPWWSGYAQGFQSQGHPLPILEHHSEGKSSSSTSTIDLGHSAFQTHSAASSAVKDVKPGSSALPGADYAASIVNSVQDFSSRAISNMDRFTEGIHKVTMDLQPIYSHWQTIRSQSPDEVDGASKSADGFWSWLGSSSSSSSSSSHHSSSSSHHSCACACAGCACACAGGGR